MPSLRPPSLQTLIQGLSGFWDERGCAVLPPCTLEVPMGLLHPEVFFRLLDPEAWRAAFLQPVYRPADSRGGEHPLRAGRHHQFQVVTKGIGPREPRELFTGCLRAAGLDLARHDLRFHAHHLEVAALGAAGRGWRAELDGLGLGRITFLESFAGRPSGGSEAPVVELAFGVESLAMVVLEAESIFDLPWYGGGAAPRSRAGGSPAAEGEEDGGVEAESRSVGRSKRREAESELFRYLESEAGTAHLRRMLTELDAEARRCLDASLPRMAYEVAIRLLPILDQLDTRGDLDPRERRHWLHEIRARIARAAEVYLGQLPAVGADGPGEESPAPPSSREPEVGAAEPARAAAASESEAAGEPPAESLPAPEAPPPAKANRARKPRSTQGRTRKGRPKKGAGKALEGKAGDAVEPDAEAGAAKGRSVKGKSAKARSAKVEGRRTGNPKTEKGDA